MFRRYGSNLIKATLLNSLFVSAAIAGVSNYEIDSDASFKSYYKAETLKCNAVEDASLRLKCITDLNAFISKHRSGLVNGINLEKQFNEKRGVYESNKGKPLHW